MGWLVLALLGVGSMAGLALLGLPRPLWSFAGAALMLGATGYALSGSPGLPSRPAQPAVAAEWEDPEVLALRDRLFGNYSLDHAYLIAADAVGRDGDHATAARALLGGIQRVPGSVSLWTALGGELAARDGTVSPPARLAFDRALRLAPAHPGPPFFLGLVLVRGNQLGQARPWWARALALCPPGASYRRDVAERLALLDRLLAERGAPGSDGAPPPPLPRP